jgi:zinc transport system permease protein
VLNIRVVGIILILSLLTIPQATANLFTKDFRKMLMLSSLFAFVGTISGLFISYFMDIPSGAAIIFTLVVIFALLRTYKQFYK